MKPDVGVIYLHIQIVYVSFLFLLCLYPIIDQMNGHLASSEKSSWPNTKVEGKAYYKTIMLFIDSLESNFFINPELMPYLSGAMQMNNTCVFNIKPESSTFPGRIKAMFSGIPSTFHDILTYGYGDLRDNILSQANEKGFKVVFYGENTWLKVYPKAFIRSKGVDPFNMTNISKADNLVSTHMMKEYFRNWDIMILHYIGLGHLSRFTGPKSYEITTKIKEMDFIISEINKFMVRQMMLNQNVVLVVSSGKSRSYKYHNEIPFILMNLHCEKRNFSIYETDIAPLLSSLLDLPTPAESIGVMNLNFYKDFNSTSRIKLIMKNNEHLRKLFIKYGGDSSKLLVYNYIKELINNPKLLLDTSFEDLLQGLNAVQLHMSQFLREQRIQIDTFTLGMCITLFMQIAILLSNDREMILTWKRFHFFIVVSFISFLFLTLSSSPILIPSKLPRTSLAIMFWFNLLFFTWKPQQLKLIKIMPKNIYSILLVIQYFGLSTGLISVEEEHLSWYYGVTTYMICSLYTGERVFLHLLIFHILLSKLNTTEVINANIIRAIILFIEENKPVLRNIISLFAQEFIATWCARNIIFKYQTSKRIKLVNSLLFNLLLLLIFIINLYKDDNNVNNSSIISGSLTLQLMTIGIFICLFFRYYFVKIMQPRYYALRYKLMMKHFLNCATLFTISLLCAFIQIENQFIFALIFLCSSIISKMCLMDELRLTGYHNILGNLFIFYQGYIISGHSEFIKIGPPSTIILNFLSIFGSSILSTVLLFFHSYKAPFFGFHAFRTRKFFARFSCLNFLGCGLTIILNSNRDSILFFKVIFVIIETIIKSTILIVILLIDITCSKLY